MKSLRIYCIGVAGMGMYPLAIYLKQMGHQVWGYDMDFPKNILQTLTDIQVHCMQEPLWVEGIDLFIHSSAIHPEHPLLKKAIERSIPFVKRGDYWAKLVSEKKLLAIVGSHGKTTTTAMLVHILKKANFPFSYMIGGVPNDPVLLPGHYEKNSQWVVSEIDESDGTIDNFTPTITLAINFDWDHCSTYKNQEDFEITLSHLFKKTKEALVITSNDSVLKKLTQSIECPCYSIGEESEYNVDAADQLDGSFTVSIQGIFARVEGSFNVYNASLALFSANLLTHIEGEQLEGFLGVSRRQDILYQDTKRIIIADYAHHPTEIEAVMAYAKKKVKGPQIIIFEPHRYTRTKQYAKTFAYILSNADYAFLLPVYPASEAFIEEGSSSAILKKCLNKQKVQYIENIKDVEFFLKKINFTEGSLLFIGAGSINKHAERYTQYFLATKHLTS